MARPIKETPVLKDKDASAFVRSMKKVETKKVDPQTKERIKINFERFSSIAKF